MKLDVLITKARLATLAGGRGPFCGRAMRNIGLIEEGVIGFRGAQIAFVGDTAEAERARIEADLILDVEGRLVTPGLIDAHTHLVHAGSRENELVLKLQGKSYLEILQEGGGIHATVRATRSASEEDLEQRASRSLRSMLLQGVTTVEAKSGYGLDRDTELKQLNVAKRLNQLQPIEIVSTFLGPHAVPESHIGREEDFLNEMIKVAMEVKEQNLAEFCDIFCENGVFSLAQSRHYLSVCRSLGFQLKIHADELEPLGGAGLAAELRAVTADHVVAAKPGDLMACAQSGVILVLLPGTSWNLGSKPANARFILDEAQGAVAIATDYNPGSCPSESLQLMMAFAVNQYRMTPEEVLTAVTRNAAWAVGRGDRIGSLEVGKQADVCIWDTASLAYIPYHFGTNHIWAVFKRGQRVV